MEKKLCHTSMANKLFWLCTSVYTISCLGRFNYGAAMAEIILKIGFTKSQAGLVGTALFAVYAFCQIITGVLGDRFSPKKMIFVGLIGSTFVNLLMGFSSTLPIMFVLWMINGVFQSCMWPPISRIFAEMLPPEKRKKAGSTFGGTIPVAAIIIFAMSALSIKYVSWRLIFFLPSVLMLISAVVWFIGMTKIEMHTEKHGTIEPVTKQEKRIKSQKNENILHIFIVSGLLFVMVGAISHGLLKDGIQSWLPTILVEQFKMVTASSVAVSIILPVLNIIGVIFTRWVATNYMKNELSIAGIFFIGAFVSLVVLYFYGEKSGVLTVSMLAIVSTCMVGANILLINLVPIHFGKIGKTSTVTGCLNCLAYGGSAISSYGIGAAAEHFGWNFAVLIWMGFALAALIACFWGKDKWGRYIKNE